jgi:hypothetical protein
MRAGKMDAALPDSWEDWADEPEGAWPRVGHGRGRAGEQEPAGGGPPQAAEPPAAGDEEGGEDLPVLRLNWTRLTGGRLTKAVVLAGDGDCAGWQAEQVRRAKAGRALTRRRTTSASAS